MFGNRPVFGRKPTEPPPPRLIPFEPEDSPRHIANPVARGHGELPYTEIINAIRARRGARRGHQHRALADYLGKMATLDAAFREAVPDYEERLQLLMEDHYPFGDRP